MANTPAHFKPPVAHDEFISGLTDKPEDRIEVGILLLVLDRQALQGQSIWRNSWRMNRN
jgi:hypothetical protein